MKTQTASISLAASSANNVCLSQTPTQAAGFTLNGSTVTAGVAVLDVARRVLFTTAANETAVAKSAQVRGTDRNGNAIYEAVVLPNISTVATLQDFKTVTSIAITANAAGAITVGTNGVASTRWIVLNPHIDSIGITFQVNLGGVTANYSVEATLDPVDQAAWLTAPDSATTTQAQGSITNWVPPVAFALANPMTTVTLTALTADALAGTAYPFRAVRLTINSGALTAGPRITVLQSGIA